MDMVSILARVATGFAARIAAGGLAIYAACEAWGYVAHVFSTVNGVLQ